MRLVLLHTAMHVIVYCPTVPPNVPAFPDFQRWKVLHRDQQALVVTDLRALPSFRVCVELGQRCLVNSPRLLRDLDLPPSVIPAPSKCDTNEQHGWDKTGYTKCSHR